MEFERFTGSARRVVVLAQEAARAARQQAHIPLDPHTRQTLLGALREADKRGDVHVLTADLLLSLVAGQRGAARESSLISA